MASEVAVQLFVQRLLSEKDDTVNKLIRSISRGTGHDFGGKNGFVQETNRVLSDLGYMLVRVAVNGTHYYSLKDLECSATSVNNLRALNHSMSADDDIQTSSSMRNVEVDNGRAVDIRYTAPELSVYFDAMSHIISERIPLLLNAMTGSYRDSVTWSSLCSKYQIPEASAQRNLAERFHHDKWIRLDPELKQIVPGIRFYFEYAENYDLSGHPECFCCKGKIIYNIAACSKCEESFHEECTGLNDSGDRHCLICLKST